jgi:HSP20 family protein
MAHTRRLGMRGVSGEILVLQREVTELFERLNEYEADAPAGAASFRPALDIFECEAALMVVIEVPGFNPESLKVSLSRDLLSISGERRSARKSGIDAFVCMERPHGRFQRSIRLDRPVDIAKAEARLHRGLLTIRLPRLNDRRGRAIAIPVVRDEEEQ